MPHERLTALDASFLHLERLETPMHVGVLTVFEGEPFFEPTGRFRLAEVRDLVAGRLARIPRFRQRVQAVPLDAGQPIWVDDDRFDIAYHVRHTALPRPGEWPELLTLFERLQAQTLDRTRPLWELWFVEGLQDGHVALIQKTHHALVDGVSGVDVATVLLDFEPDGGRRDTTTDWTPRPGPTPGRLLLDTVREQLAGAAGLARRAQDAVEDPQPRAGRVAELARSVATLADHGLVAPRTSLNRPVGRARRFGRVRVSLDEVKTVRAALGGTVNDVILAGVAGGLGRLLDSRGELTPDLTLKVFCPVSVRADHEHLRLGNRVSALFVPLPVAEADPARRLDQIRVATAQLKERDQAVGAAALLGLGEYAAPTLLGLGARLAHHQPFFNLVCTNVPGPQLPLYCMGARMLEAYPMVPLTKNLNLGIAILSYCGHLHLGLLADRDQWPDLEVLEGGIDGRVRRAPQDGDRAMSHVGRDAWALADDVRAGAVSAVEVLEEHLARLEALNPSLNAVWFVDLDAARADAHAIDQAVASGTDPGPLAGVPMGVKELASVAGWPDTHASLVYADAVAHADDTEVARLRGAGAVLVGLTTASEFGAVSFTNTPLHGVTRNPWDLSRTPGGSSGGSSAAVAAGLFPACTGSDGGGSIRIPASYCGLPGMKSTYGRTGAGPGPYSFSMTSVPGPVVRSVRDAARYLDVIAGPTVTDPTSLARPAGSLEADLVNGEAIHALRGLRVAWSSTLGYASAEPAVEAAAHEAATALVERAGLQLVDVPVEFPKPGSSWGILSTLDTLATHYEAQRDHTDDLTDVLQAGLLSFERLRPDLILRAIRGRRAAVAAAVPVFETVDLLLTPTTPTPAFEAEGRLRGTVNGKEVSLAGLSAPFTMPFNLTGQPACSVPAGFVDGLPVALQVVARRHDDRHCLAAAAVLEDTRPWPKQAPMPTGATPGR